MASPPEAKRATGNRGAGTPPRPAPVPSPAYGQPTASCLEYITNNPELSDPRKGTGVHRVIREQLGLWFAGFGYGPPVVITLPDATFAPFTGQLGLTGGGAQEGEGDIDLAFHSRTGNVMLLAEIKPANWRALGASPRGRDGKSGEAQLENYIDKANNNEEMKRRYHVRVFSPMLPERFGLPAAVYWQSRQFEVRWCKPGLILYKEVRRKDDEKEKEKGERATHRGVKVDTYRTAVLPEWTPASLRRAYETATLEDGVYRDRYSAPYAYGHSSHVVVWIKRTALGRELQLYQEFPESPGFYAAFQRARGLSDAQTDRIRRVYVDWNRDMWSLIGPDPVTGLVSGRTPYSARDELRTINERIMLDVFAVSGVVLGTGAAVGGIASVARSAESRTAGTTGARSLSAPTEEPLPAGIVQAVERGAEDFARFMRSLVH